MFSKLKKFLKSKKAVGSVATAIKVGTACVLGAAVLVGGVALTNDIVLPNTSDKVNNVAEYEGGGAGGSTGGVTPVNVPVVYDPTAPELNPSGIIPDGYRYVQNFQICDAKCGENLTNFDGVSKCYGCMTRFNLTPIIIPSGSAFPEIAQNDGYETSDYYYTYSSALDGWSILVKDKTKSSYEPILESINGKPVYNMYTTFYGCTSLTTAPTIPSSVTYMQETFGVCPSLTEITYAGTMEQWDSIEKYYWNGDSNSAITVVHCSDGDLAV